MSVLFIVNPNSGRVNRKGSKLEKTSQRMVHDGITHQFHWLKDFNELPRVMMSAQEAQINKIFIEGGDGSVQGVLSAFLRHNQSAPTWQPKFAIIAGGMTNQISKNIGLKPKHILSATKSDLPCKTMPLLDIKTGCNTHHYGFLLSTGAVPIMTEYTKQKLHGRGIGGSFAVIGGILKGVMSKNNTLLKPTPIALNFEKPQQNIHKDHTGTILTTLPSLIMGLDPFWTDDNNGQDPDRPLRLTYVDAPYRKLPLHLLSLWAGQKHKDRSADGFKSWILKQIDYHYQGSVLLDGEIITSPENRFSITASQPLQFILSK